METTEDQSIHWQCVERKGDHCVWPLHVAVVLACLLSHQVLLTTHIHTCWHWVRLTSHPTHYRSHRGRVLRVKLPNQQWSTEGR